tara:strand:+ start:2833 stop:3165 length:333 start_codon:yes stop_codon:yes gene_type:complete
MNWKDRLLTEITKAEEQPERKMSGATRAYKRAFSKSWKQGGKAGKLVYKAGEGEKSGSYIGKLHAATMRTVADRLRAQSTKNLDTAIKLRPLIPQSRTRQQIRSRDVKLR